MRGRRYKPPTRLNAQGSAESASDDEDSANGNEEAEGQDDGSEQDAKLIRLPDGTDAIDITGDWRSGGLVLSEAGTYALSGDVETTGMLTIAAPAGEVIMLDFAGHKATVNGDAYAGIDVGSSVGEVVIRDSSYKEGAPKANLVVEGNKVTDALCGIQANYAPQEGDVPTPKLTLQGVGIDVNLNTVDADQAKNAHDAFGVYFGYADGNDSREAVDALLQDISVSVHLNEFDLSDEEKAELKNNDMVPLSEKTTGIAYGIYTNVKEVGLSGVLATTTVSANNTCDLYSVNDASFRFDRTSEPQNTMRVYAAGNGESTVFATFADDFEDGSTVLSSLENAADSETILKQDDRAIVFAKAEDLSTDSANSHSTASSIGALMTPQAAPSIALEPAALELWAGDGAAEVDVAYGGEAEVSAASSDESVATVSYSEGKLSVTPAGVGEATVTVSAGGESVDLPVACKPTWTVGASGYATFELAMGAAPNGGTVKLMRDIPDGSATMPKASTGSYTVDLAGHAIGCVTVAAGEVTLTSSEGRGKVVSTSASGVAITHNANNKKLTMVGVDVEVAAGDGKATGINNANGALSLEGVGVTVSGNGSGDLVGVAVAAGASSAVTIAGGSVTVTQEGSGSATALSSAYTGTASKRPKLAASDAAVSATAGGASYALMVGSAPSGAFGGTVENCTLSARTTGADGTAAAVLTAANGGSAKVAGGSLAAAAEGAGAVGYALRDMAGKGKLVVGGEVSLAGATADVMLPAGASVLELSADFSAAEGSVSVLSAGELTGDVFATVAEGGDAAAMAKAFAPSDADEKYRGYSPAADGLSLKWAEAASEEGSVTITIHSNYPDSTVPEDITKISGTAGDIIETATLDRFTYDHWSCGSSFLKTKDEATGEFIDSAYRYSTKTWTLPESSLDLYVTWTHNSSKLYLSYFNGARSQTITYSGFEGDPILDPSSGDRVTSFPATVSREGYRLLGWRLGIDSDEVISDPVFPEVFPAGNVTYSQVWIEDKSSTPSGINMDLYPLLTNSDGSPKSTIVRLDKQGSWYLSKSVDGFTGRLVISKAGNYEIDLRGNSIGFGSVDSTTVASNCALRLGGDAEVTEYKNGQETPIDVKLFSSVGKGTLSFVNAGGVQIGANSSLEIKDVNALKSYTLTDKITDYSVEHVLSTSAKTAVTNESGLPKVQNIVIDSCNLTLDASNQVAGGNASPGYSSTASAVHFASPNTNSIEIKNSVIAVSTGKPNVTSGGAQGSVDAVAVYVRATSTVPVSISDSAINASAQQGSAYSIVRFHYSQYAPEREAVVKLQGNVGLTANGGGEGEKLSVGLLNTTKTRNPLSSAGAGRGAILDGSIAFNTTATANGYALLTDSTSEISNCGFTLGSNFSAETALPVSDGAFFNIDQTGSPDSQCPLLPQYVQASCNQAGSYIASFGFDAAKVVQDQMAGYLGNGKTGSNTYIVADNNGLKFDYSLDEAEALIKRSGEVVAYGAFENVATSAHDGDTIIVNKSIARRVAFPVTDAEKDMGEDAKATYIVDLNGHELSGFECRSSADVTLTDSTSGKSAIRVTTGLGAVAQWGDGALTISGIDVQSDAGIAASYGVYVGAGRVILDSGTTVRSTSAAQAASGAAVNGGLEVKDASVSVEGGYGAFDALGIQLRSDSSDVTISDVGAVTAIGHGGTVYGIKADKGALVSKGSVAAEGRDSAAELYGLYSTTGASVTIDGSSISVGADAVSDEGAASMTAWNIYSEGGLSLGGNITMSNFKRENAMHVHHSGPFTLGEDFSVSGEASTLNVESTGLASDNVFAVPAEGVSSVAGKASFFAAYEAPSNSYAGFEATAKNESLAWAAPEGGIASTGGKQFASVQAAINAAAEGESVEVLADCTSLPLAVSKNVTINLSGHKVTIPNGITASGVSTGVVVSAGTLTIKDSGETPGALLLGLSAIPGASEIRGISVTSNGSLKLDGCTVLTYGTGNGAVSVLNGVYVDIKNEDARGKILEVANGARVCAASNAAGAGILNAEANDALSGARSVSAINIASAPQDSEVAIESGCIVEARSMLAAEADGEIILHPTGGWNVGSQENALNSTTVREFDPGEDKELYDAIVARFKSVAKYDATASDGVYGAHIYYAAPMELTDDAHAGTYVWAFSKPVDGVNVGKDEYIVPDKIYVQSTYQNPADARGIAIGPDAVGAIDIGCAATAFSQTGNAYAVDANSGFDASATVNVLGTAELSAITEGSSYFKNTKETPNLNKALEIGDENVVFYSKSSSVKEVVLTDVQAFSLKATQGIARNDEAKLGIVLRGAASYSANGRDGAEICAESVSLAPDFEGNNIRFVSNSGENSVGTEFAAAISDAVLSETQRDAFLDATETLLPVFKGEGKALQWGSSYTVEFLDSYGTLIAALDAADGYTVQMPSADFAKKPDTSTSTFTLVGWSTDPKAAADDSGLIGDGASISFKATDFKPTNGKVTFYPVYREHAKGVTFTFVGARNSDGTSIAATKVGATAAAGMAPDALAKVPVAQDYGTMKFVGWKTSIDKQGTLRVVDPDCLSSVTTDGDATFVAEYVQIAEGTRLVVFKVEDYLYAYSVACGAIPSFKAAAQVTTGVSDESAMTEPSKTEIGENWVFIGYDKGKKDYSQGFPDVAEIGASEALPVVAEGDEPVCFTAVFSHGGKVTCTVMLHYYADWGQDGSPSWKYNDTDDATYRNRKYVSYGTDLSKLKPGVKWADVDSGLIGVEILDYADKDARGTWRAHKFLGWSVRKTDKQPMENLPLVGMGMTTGTMSSSTAYYALYSDNVKILVC